MSSAYAAKTEVAVSKSRLEIEAVLKRYGATGFAYMTQGPTSVVAFEMRGRRVLFRLVMPGQESREVRLTESGRVRTGAQQRSALEQVERQRWRALLLVVKAKLESVAAGIESFEEAFAVHTVLPNGQTVGEWVLPQIAAAYERGEMPPMLPGATIALPAGSNHR